MDKKYIEEQMLAELNKMDKTSINNYHKKLWTSSSSDEFKNAQTIGLTISRFPEVDTHTLD